MIIYGLKRRERRSGIVTVNEYYVTARDSTGATYEHVIRCRDHDIYADDDGKIIVKQRDAGEVLREAVGLLKDAQKIGIDSVFWQPLVGENA